MEINFLILPLAALIPMVVGAAYYHPKVLGSFWMKASGVTEEQTQTGNMALIFGLAYLFSLLIAFSLGGMVIHQLAVQSLLSGVQGFGEVGSEVQTFFDNFMKTYGDTHRSFGHGALHGVFAAIFFAWPVIGILSLFERRGWKYTAVHVGYWIISLGLMGGIICAYA